MKFTEKSKSVTKSFYDTISKLIAFEESDWNVLANEADVIKTWIPDLVGIFYDTLYGINDTSAIFHTGERGTLEEKLEQWVVDILSGDQGEKFWNHQRYIALLHIKRGTKNLYMLGMMNRMQQVFLEKSMANFEQDKAIRVFNAFLRLSGMVAGLIAQCYDEVIETSTHVGLSKVGLNPALISRIKSMQIDSMLKDAETG